VDTDNGSTDTYDYDCSHYYDCLADGDADYTHEYDDEDFTAAVMCCACKMQSGDGKERGTGADDDYYEDGSDDA